jgi:hypothetical protein
MMDCDSTWIEVFSDDFAAYPLAERLDDRYFGVRRMPGTFGTQTLGPWRQSSLHYMWRSERIKGWSECSLPWRLVDRDGRRWLEQPEHFFNVVLTAGDPEWSDYALEVDLAVGDGPGGPLVRYRTSRQNYWVAFQAGEPVKLIRRCQDEQVVLGTSGEWRAERERVYHCRVHAQGDRIEVAVDGRVCVAVDDAAYARGSIGLRTEGPCRFSRVRVTVAPSDEAAWRARTAARTARLAKVRESAPTAALRRSVQLPADTTAVHLRDVNDDGCLEIVACQVVVPKLDYIQLAKMTVLDWDGRELWSVGDAMPEKFSVHGGFAFNTADIDGDGRTEILTTRNFEILILDGRTGTVKRRAPTPASVPGQEDAYPRVVGDSLLVCNLRGLSSAQDIIVKDRYCNLWAYTGNLEPLWHRSLNTGHYPRAADINGDGRDEVMAGYSMLGPDGATLWTVPGGDPDRNRYPGPEHMDAVLIGRFGGPETPLRIAMAASDLGFILMDAGGRVLAQHRVGHAQALAVARFQPDLPGRQFLVATAWGNFGILNLFDAEGNLLLTKEVPGCRVVPVNWRGDGGALMLWDGWLADGNFDPVVELPAGTRVYPFAYDVDGDGADEVFLRQDNELRIYGPAGKGKRASVAPRLDLSNWNEYGGFFR